MGWGNSPDPAAPRADGGRPADCAVQGCSSCVKMKKLYVIAMEFVNDHGKLHDYKADFRPSGKKYRKPEWDGDLKASKPVSYSMGDHIEVWLTFKVEPPNACPETGGIIGRGPQGITFDLTNHTFVPGLNKVFMVANKAVASVVQILDFEVFWKSVGVSAQFDFFSDFTKNRIYVTYDKPYDGQNGRWNNTVTEKRLEWLCTLTSGDTYGHDSVKKIHGSSGKYAVGAPIPKHHWEVAGGLRCECIDLSIFYMLASQMLGLRTGELMCVYPLPGKAAKESTSSTDRASRLIMGTEHEEGHGKHSHNEELLMIDGSGGWNQFEACFKFTHPDNSGKMKSRYYAGGAGVYDTPQEVMKSVCKETHWTYVAGHLQSTGQATETICKDPGPSPVDVW
jgi:hypothetical protein